jgi:hypothetical protein
MVSAGVFLAAVLAGCSPSGPATGEVSGKVTFKGKAVTEGTVTFLNPKEGGAAEGELGPDGTYKLNGKVVVGEYVVVITPLVQIVDTDPGKSPPAPVEKPAPNIPQKYRQQGTTPLKETVKEGKNEFNFDLK